MVEVAVAVVHREADLAVDPGGVGIAPREERAAIRGDGELAAATGDMQGNGAAGLPGTVGPGALAVTPVVLPEGDAAVGREADAVGAHGALDAEEQEVALAG